jgi:hypothetical protein
MSVISEGGSAKNLAKFGVVISIADGMGTLYNPANADISVPSLKAKETEFKAAMADLINESIPYKNAVNARVIEYDKMSNIAIRVKGALASSGASKEIIKDAKGIINKIVGRRTTKKPEPDPNNPEGGEISTSQMGFDDRKGNFELLIALLKGEPLYKPNENDLKVTELETYVKSLEPLNLNAVNAKTAVDAKRMVRDVKFYGPGLSLSELTGTVKAYVKSVLGANDPLYKKLAAIKIIKPKGF